MMKQNQRHNTDDIMYDQTIGIDGCKGGWMTAILKERHLSLERYQTIDEVMMAHSDMAAYLIDMPIGLASNGEEAMHRPEKIARKMLSGRSSSLFPAPLRSVARAETIFTAWEENRKGNGRANYMTMGIRGAVNEVDLFLQQNPRWNNVLLESHPELCFILLNQTNMQLEKKTTPTGMAQRLQILRSYNVDVTSIVDHPLFLKFPDDVLDASCLALVGQFVTSKQYATIPEEPDVYTDATGLKMQLVIPKQRQST